MRLDLLLTRVLHQNDLERRAFSVDRFDPDFIDQRGEQRMHLSSKNLELRDALNAWLERLTTSLARAPARPETARCDQSPLAALLPHAKTAPRLYWLCTARVQL